MQSVLNILCPAMMVFGALSSMIVNIYYGGDKANSLQWLGAALLYTALTLRNMK